MKLTHLAVGAVCLGFAIGACKKEQGAASQKSSYQLKGDPGNGDGKDVMADFFEEVRSSNTRTYTIDPRKGGTITAEMGTQFVIEPHQLRNADGGEIQGVVYVEVLEVYGRGSMIQNNFPTEAAYEEGQPNQVLTSAATFDLNMTTQDGGEVTTTPDDPGIEVLVPIENTGEPNENMTIWEGEQSDDQNRDNAWNEKEGAPVEIVGENYRFNMPAPFGRINLDVRLDNLATAIQLRVKLPAGYDENNAEVFVVFDGFPNAAASMDVYDWANGEFGEHLGFVDPGDQGSIVTVARQPGTGQLMYDIVHVTFGVNNSNGNHLQIVPSLAPTDLNTLNSAILGLP
jgi:hypothetical protein